MNNSYFFIALLLCIALVLTFFFPVVAATLAESDYVEYNNGYGGVSTLEDDHAQGLESRIVISQILEECNQGQTRGLLDVEGLLQWKGLWGNRSLSQSPTEKIFGASSFMDNSLRSNTSGKIGLSFVRQQALCESRPSFSWIISRQQQRYEKQSKISDGRKSLGIKVNSQASEGDARSLFKGGDFNGEIGRGIWRMYRHDSRSNPQNNLEDCSIEQFNPECNDGDLFNGYHWRGEGWVPGLITRETHFLPAPPFTAGWAVYYAKGVMEATARYRNLDLSNCVDGVAMMSCADIGQTVWIRRQFNSPWEGPFLVVDCAEWDDHYPVTLFRGEVVEVGFETAKRWGILDDWKTVAHVLKSRHKPPNEFNYEAVFYGGWFRETARFYSPGRVELPARYIYDGSGRWLIEGRWKSFLAWEDNPMYIEPWIRDLIYRIGD